MSGLPHSESEFDPNREDGGPVVTVGTLQIVPVGREAKLYFGPAPLERGSSEAMAMEAIRALAEYAGITAIVDLNADDMEKRAVEGGGLAYRGISVKDDGNALSPSILDAASCVVSELIATGHRVYLHCTFGRGRSPTIAAAYLIAHEGLSTAEAQAHIEGLDSRWLHRGIWMGYDARFPGSLHEFEMRVREGRDGQGRG